MKFVVCLARSVYPRVLEVRGGNKVQEEEGNGSRVKERKGENRESVCKAEQEAGTRKKHVCRGQRASNVCQGAGEAEELEAVVAIEFAFWRREGGKLNERVKQVGRGLRRGGEGTNNVLSVDDDEVDVVFCGGVAG